MKIKLRLRYALYSLLASFMLLVAVPNVAYAHELQVDGPISVVMHIDPDDNPVAGQSARFSFEFGRSDGSFNLQVYQLSYLLQVHGRTLQSGPIIPEPKSGILGFEHSFQASGYYNLQIRGRSKQSGAPDFTTKFIVSVTPSARSLAASNPNLGRDIALVSVSSLVGLIGIAVMAVKSGGRYPRPPVKP